MSAKPEDVYHAGLELNEDERTVVAHRLLASINPDDGTGRVHVDEAWREEIASRLDEIESGAIELSTFAEVRAKARAILSDMRS